MINKSADFGFSLRLLSGTYEWREVLETVRVQASHTDSGLVAQHERNLDDTGDTSCHQGISEDRVDHGADHQALRVSRHGIARHEDDNRRNQVPLGSAVAVTAQPHTQQTSAPPDNAHSGVLEIVVDPRAAPAVLSKGVDTAPGCNNQGVEELLAAAGTAQPELAHQQQDGQADSVGDERTAHDEVGQTLSHVISLAEAQGCNTTKEHLRPTDQRHNLAQDAMGQHEDPPDPGLSGLDQVQLQVEAQGNLDDQKQHQPVCEGVVNIRSELAALVGVAEEVADDSDDGSDGLERDVPAGSYDL